MYTISNSTYPGDCAATITIPVVEDAHPTMAVNLPFRNQLQIGTPFSFTFDQVIQAADRHVYVHGRPHNPVAFVEDWINLLRWEVSNLWSIDVPGSRFARNMEHALTQEHYKRSGEILAEGVAIAFLEHRLDVSRQRFFFFSGTTARPDFVVRLKARHRTALAVNRKRIMVEVRSRSAVRMRSLSEGDRADLTNKKAGVKGIAGVLSVYCCYGSGSHRDGTSHSRIHLADPPVDDAPDASDSDLSAIAIHHYLRVTSQLGLWDHRDHLLQAARGDSQRQLDRMQMRTGSIPRGIVRRTGSQAYRGREFNQLIELAARRPATLSERDAARSEIRRRVEAGDFGTIVFRGLNIEALELIERSDWIALANYRDEGATAHRTDYWVRSDGLFRVEHVIEAGSEEAQAIRAQLRSSLDAND